MGEKADDLSSFAQAFPKISKRIFEWDQSLTHFISQNATKLIAIQKIKPIDSQELIRLQLDVRR